MGIVCSVRSPHAAYHCHPFHSLAEAPGVGGHGRSLLMTPEAALLLTGEHLEARGNFCHTPLSLKQCHADRSRH